MMLSNFAKIPVKTLFFSAALLAWSFVAASAAVPRVVVTIKPVHALVSSIMHGIGEPHLLIRGTASPHDYALRPSDAVALQSANIVVWVGETLETFLAPKLSTIAARARIVELGKASGVTYLPLREGGSWGASHEGHGHGHENDPHIWLDPRNAQNLAATIANALSAADPANKKTYQANAIALKKELALLETEIGAALAPIKGRNFLVYHDATQYFETRFAIPASGSVSLGDGRAPGAKRIAALRTLLRNSNISCMFFEPQFTPKHNWSELTGRKLNHAMLDPLGAQIPQGPAHYPALLRQIAAAFVQCLSAP